jgi:AcrR family transcriptional regulator
MPRAPELEWVKPPRQARSQETLDRLLEATEGLLLEKPFETITVTEIARRARSSVGAFYTRFPDKEALLRCVLERFYGQAVATASEALAPERWEGTSAADFLEASLRFLIRVFRERRYLVAALSQRAAVDAELTAMGERIGQLVSARLEELLVHRGEAIGHADPAAAVRLCVWLIMSAFEARAVFAPRADMPDSRLAAEVAAMCLSYLKLDEVAREALARERLVG